MSVQYSVTGQSINSRLKIVRNLIEEYIYYLQRMCWAKKVCDKRKFLRIYKRIFKKDGVILSFMSTFSNPLSKYEPKFFKHLWDFEKSSNYKKEHYSKIFSGTLEHELENKLLLEKNKIELLFKDYINTLEEACVSDKTCNDDYMALFYNRLLINFGSKLPDLFLEKIKYNSMTHFSRSHLLPDIMLHVYKIQIEKGKNPKYPEIRKFLDVDCELQENGTKSNLLFEKRIVKDNQIHHNLLPAYLINKNWMGLLEKLNKCVF